MGDLTPLVFSFYNDVRDGWNLDDERNVIMADLTPLVPWIYGHVANEK